jgi:hypothetical protein
VLGDFDQVLFEAAQQLGFQGRVAGWPRPFFLQLLHQFSAHFREVVDEVQGVLNLMGDARRELAQGCQLFPLHQLRLRRAKFLQCALQDLFLVLQLRRAPGY